MKTSWGFDLRSLNAFVLACKTGSMAAAAQRLHMTQPAVSYMIRNLETSLGARLIDRGRRPFSLTPRGAFLRDAAEQILAAAQRIPSRLRELDEGAPERLRIGIVDSLACPFVPELLSSLRPSLDTLQVSAGLARSLREAFLDHRFDVILTNDPMDDVDGIVRHPLLSEPYILLLPPVLPPGADPADLKSLAQTLDLIRWSSGSFIGTHIEAQIRRLRVDIPRHFEFDSSDTLTGIVAAGQGFAIMTPLCLFNSVARQGAARAVPFPGPPFSRVLQLVSREGELDRVSQKMARIARRILRDRYLSGMLRIAPWLRGQIVIGNPRNSG